jgi:uncharacterized protein (TIGR02246 family)
MTAIRITSSEALRWLATALLALIFAAGPAPAAAQDDTQAIEAVLAQWAATYSSPDATAEAMLKLYDPDTVFWGTGAQTPFVGADQIAPYFTRQFTTFTKRKVSFVESVIRTYGDTATATGLYRFEVTTADGASTDVTHRFSFAFHKGEKGWIIVHQHSSQMPR